MRKIIRLVVHCSDSPASMDIGKKEINQWHLARGFSGIGYHKVIRRDGTVERGREDAQVGAHVEGFNSTSLGVCVVGRDMFEPMQVVVLVKVLVDWCQQYGLTAKDVVGHTELNSYKTCPNMNMDTIRKCVEASLTHRSA